MDRARAELFRAERVRELYGRRAGLGAYAASLIALLAAGQAVAVIWPTLVQPSAMAWLGLMLLVQGGLMALTRRFHARVRTDRELAAWARARAAAEIVHGGAWAMAFPLVYVPGQPITLVAVLGMVAGMIGGVAAGLAVHMPAMAGFVAASVSTSVAALLLMRSGPMEGYAAVMMLACGLLSLANAARASVLYNEAIGLRLDLATQLEARRRLQEEAEEGRQLAEAAAAERVRFFGAASHDLRQPVHALGLYAALLRRDPPARERRELIANIAACVDSLNRLFNGILGVARAAKARHDDQLIDFPLQEVFDRVALHLGPEAQDRGLSLRLRPTRLWVRGDPGVAERILGNLAGNAVKYTERGGVLVGARRRGAFVDLVVADTGVGLSAADRARIFDAFYQVGLPHRDRTQGFGLGLATVRQLCASHGYAVDVRSELGRGARFRVSLPRGAAQGVPGAALTADAPDMPVSLNVLLVEDDPLVADAVTRLLVAWGAAVHVCRDAGEALALLDRVKGGRWHAILDYRLPGERTGLDLADDIHARQDRRITISLLTGEADPAVFAAAEQRGILVLQKPLKPIRLRALLARETAATAAQDAGPVPAGR